jgi:Holliday junction DNA helicase RuvA
MIDFVRGTVIRKLPTNVVVENAGVGFDLQISLNTYQLLPETGAQVQLMTYLHVREDILQLYAFADDRERVIFKGLISISGVGPKLAQTILSGIQPVELLDAISRNDVDRLTAISGVGKKTAQRLVIELKEKFTQLGLVSDGDAGEATAQFLTPVEEEARLALMSLGYKKPVVEKALARVRKAGTMQSVEEIIKQALQQI